MNKIVKICMLIIIVFILSGCNKINLTNNEVIIDEETCVEYKWRKVAYAGGLTLRVNQDGTPKLNKECLNKKGM